MRLVACWLLVAACSSDPECSQSIAAYCGSNAGCPLTWTQAQDPAFWGCGSGGYNGVQVGMCGDAYLASRAYVDTGTDYYFDANGRLYRIEIYGGALGTTPKCVAGTGPAPVCGVGQMATNVCPQP